MWEKNWMNDENVLEEKVFEIISGWKSCIYFYNLTIIY